MDKRFVVFDSSAVSALRHHVFHLKRSLDFIPKEIRSLKWFSKTFQKEVDLETTVKYIGDKMDAIIQIIKLAESSPIEAANPRDGKGEKG